jgi:hypothetical protein
MRPRLPRAAQSASAGLNKSAAGFGQQQDQHTEEGELRNLLFYFYFP